MNKNDVIRRCKIILDTISEYRKKEDEQEISDCLDRQRVWSFLPWWKPISREEAIIRLKKHWSIFPSMASWGTFGEAEELLDAANATQSDTMWVSAGAHILDPKFENRK